MERNYFNRKDLIRFMLLFVGIVLILVIPYAKQKTADISPKPTHEVDDYDPDEAPVPQPFPVSAYELKVEPKNQAALGGYNVLIADRGNNRIIEVTPDKKIVWQYTFDLPKPGQGADDAFFGNNGKTVSVNLEFYHLVQQIDYMTRKVVWSYGVPNKSGSGPGYLNRPDDAYLMPNGNIITADIQNCRVLEISPDKKIVRQFGVTKECSDQPGHLNKPNGDTPIANGHMLISNIRGHNVIELDQNWKQVFSMPVPLQYPSDPQLTQAGNILVADYSSPGRIIEISRQGTIVWDYFFNSGEQSLSNPSLAIELPNGNILANDDFNHRVIVIDKKTKAITWQYGVTNKPGKESGQLTIPDGVDIIKRDPRVYRIGFVIRRPDQFLNQSVRMEGYVLNTQSGYSIFSDESSGGLTINDLPIVGPGLERIQSGKKYLLSGMLIKGGLDSINKNPYHFELFATPELKD